MTWVADSFTTVLNFPKVDGTDAVTPYEPQYFRSKYAKDRFQVNEFFIGAQFHFHSLSEHTIEGKRFDFEMHTVHLLPSYENKGETVNSFFAGVLGLIFDVYDYDPSVTTEQIAIIDNFFDSLHLD